MKVVMLLPSFVTDDIVAIIANIVKVLDPCGSEMVIGHGLKL